MENNKNQRLIRIIAVLTVLGIASIFCNYYVDWLWFGALDLSSVFATILVSKFLLYFGVFMVAFLFIWLNLHLAKKKYSINDERPSETEEGRKIIYLHPEPRRWKELITGKWSGWFFLAMGIVGAFIISSSAGDKWLMVQQFIHKTSFNSTEPIFHKDLSFYFFNLPFFQLIYSNLMSLLVITIFILAFYYLIRATPELLALEWKKVTFPKRHLAVLLGAIFALKAWGYKLAAYSILFSPGGIVYGATYTDIHAHLLAYKFLLVIALLVALNAFAIAGNLFKNKITWLLYSMAVWLVMAVLLSGIYPTLVQKFVVQPNEFNKEKPYIQTATQMTRQAYDLDRIDNKEFKINYNLTMDDIEKNSATIDNIRLWDWQPLKDTYKSLQELRSYYVFNDVDIDRYMVDGKYRQVMISAREMEDMDRNPNLQREAKTWLNQRLMFTHGYGVVMSPVTEVAEEGFPQFFVKDIPPQAAIDIKVKRPEIYFGEKTDSYVIVNTDQEEFDYPMGTKNVYTTYQGDQGIKINSWSRRLMLSWVLKDYQMILSTDINNNSQVLMNRNIIQRVKKVAPYLSYDSDPYIVIGNNGKLYWILDAYTISDKYPYSQPFDRRGSNYIRNAVKVVCDAYTGELNFYIGDNSDPLIKTYQKIFPQLYKPLSSLPAGLKEHIRYPEDMFAIQANVYRTYHMTDPWVFYNKEDNWVIPKEMVDDKEKALEPYYIIMRLPGEEKEEYILMLPYTPNGRNNMIAWMCARMDGDEYGKMLVYSFPKQETIYGPMQVESRINQDTEISKQLTLWGQKGSQTHRGNLVIIPINNSILYIEPLYLQAETSKMPELKRVIAAFGNTVVMEPTLDQALERIFARQKKPGQSESGQNPEYPTTISELSKLARQYFDQSQQRLKEVDWSGYGESLRQLNEVIRKLEAATGN